MNFLPQAKWKNQSFISLKMVQTKVAYNNKLGIIAYYNYTLKTEKKQDNSKTSLLNLHDGYMSQGADLKGIKMKISPPIKRSDVKVSLSGYETPPQPGKPPTRVVPSPPNPSSFKSSCTSPNYMKSTSSFDARKEKTTKVSSSKQSCKTSSFKIVRTLSKSPSFKHSTRTTTCSSTLKDSKFPRYLKLKPGATEAEGRTELRVCSYNHCSLNGDHHKPAPPLKRFMSSRRRLLKIQKVNRTEVPSPRKAKLSECKGGRVGNQKEDFFVKIYVPDRGVDTQVSESLSDGPCSEIDFQDNLDQREDTNVSELNFSPGDEDCLPPAVRSDLEVESSPSVSLDELFCGIEWETEQICKANDGCEIFIQSECSKDQGKSCSETSSNIGAYSEELNEYPPYYYDEIVEYLCFSDADSLPYDSESTQTGERDIEEQVMVEEKDEINSGPNNEDVEEDSTLADEATVHAAELEDESTDIQGGIISDLIEEITEVQNEDLDLYQEPVKTDGDKSKEDNNTVGEIKDENLADTVKEEREPIEETITDIPRITENCETPSGATEEICMCNDDDRDVPDQSEDVAALARQKANEAAADNCVSTRSENSEDENDSSEANLDSNENDFEEEKASGVEDNSRTEEASKCISNKESDVNQELLDSCNKLKKGVRCKKEDDVDEEREFNPRGPNFLDIEPDPEAEKVDLRHQEMDDRRNAEEWMLDHALQKTVNQLAPARKRKVELLVKAFEAVLPVPKYESSVRRNLTGPETPDHEKSIQACC